MSFDFTSSANHADGTPAPLTAAPGWMSVWIKCPSAAQFRRFLSMVKAADTTQMTAIITDSTQSSTKAGYYIEAGTANQQQGVSDTMTVGQWYCLLYGLASTNSRNFQVTGLSTIAKNGIIVPAGLDTVILSGRAGDHSQNAGSLMAHASMGAARDMTAIEKLYVVGGGNLRAVSSLASLWRCNRQVSGKIPDEVGGTDLTITGTMTAGADDPVTASYFIGSNIANISVKVGNAVSLNMGALFENVNAPFTCAIMQIGAATSGTTASTATSSTGNEITVVSAAAFSAGDYIQIGSGLYPVLFVSQGTGQVFFDGPASWANGDTISRLPVTARALTGLSVTSNTLSGNAGATQNFSNLIARATANGNSALFADSNRFSYQATSTSPTATQFRPRKRRVCVKVFSRR